MINYISTDSGLDLLTLLCRSERVSLVLSSSVSLGLLSTSKREHKGSKVIDSQSLDTLQFAQKRSVLISKG